MGRWSNPRPVKVNIRKLGNDTEVEQLTHALRQAARPRLELDREQLLTLQFTKLVNYFGDELAPEWGGDYLDHGNEARIRLAHRVFLRDIHTLKKPECSWIHRIRQTHPWCLKNVVLRDVPAQELGSPVDPYLASGGSFLSTNEACQLLCLLPEQLITLKLQLLLDKLVLDEAIRRMVSPRPEWQISKLAWAAEVNRNTHKPKL